mmetsp:Transcript_34185/g.51597  ORF Transcript_34185/g.51597 Transcript_34185/m.51597 type:complete len:597 (-) Transcript_34185:556-2346(-)
MKMRHRNLDEEEEDGSDWNEREFNGFFLIFTSLLAVVFVLGKFLHDRPRLQSALPEAGLTVIVGVAASAIIWLVAPHLYDADLVVNDPKYGSDIRDIANGLLSFSPTFFFGILIPPIIFNSGYHINKRLFFRHIKPILLYSTAGTFINIIVMAVLLNALVKADLTGEFKPHFSELLVFGSLIASTDPVAILAVFQKKRVDPQLFYLIFGESVLNDGVCLVLFDAFSMIVGGEGNFNGPVDAAWSILADFLISFTGSMCLGVASGLGVALVLKFVDMRQCRLLETSFYVLVMYLPFFAAETIRLSGIVTILFTGISAQHYAARNLSMGAQDDTDVFFRIISHIAEVAIFLELGLTVFGLGLTSFEDFCIEFFLWSLLVCLVGRACSIYPMTFLFNLSCNHTKGNQNMMDELDAEGSLAYTTLNDQTAESSDMSISYNKAHMLWFSGLRGAVSYACAKNFPDDYGNHFYFVNITMLIVLVTVFVMGGLNEPFLNFLRIETGVDEKEYMGKYKEPDNLFRILDRGYIRPRVIRDYKKRKSSYNTEQIKHRISESVMNLTRSDSVEVTLDEHRQLLNILAANSLYCKRKSIYDYGASLNE